MQVKFSCDSNLLIARIEALAEHVNQAKPGDPVAEIAREIGEIDASTDVEIVLAWKDGALTATCRPFGNLARLLEAFEARQV